MQLLLALGIALLGPAAMAATDPPNLILIVADDLGWGDLGCYPKGSDWGEEAYTPTPNLDRLAASGVRFTQAYSTAMVCSPSRAGLLSGQYQQRFGFYAFGETLAPLPSNLKLLPEALHEAGYRTGMVGKWHVSSDPASHPLRRGFDRFFGFIGGQHDYFQANLGVNFPGTRYSTDAHIFDQEEKVGNVEYLTDEFTDQALGFLSDAAKAGKPFFLYLPYSDPHPPNQAPWADLQPYVAKRPDGKFTPRDVARASIENLDRNVGRIMKWLQDEELDNDTLVLFTSDNGGSDGGPIRCLQHNGGLRGRKSTFYEGGIRVPLIARWSGHLPASVVYHKPVSLLDIYPTALALGGAHGRIDTQPLDGVNLMPYLVGRSDSAPHERLYWSVENPSRWAVRDGDWKLVYEDVNPETLGRRDRVREAKLQLYDLASDPNEENDLVASKPEVVERLQELFDAFVKESRPSIYTDEIRALHERIIAEQAQAPRGPRSLSGSPGHWKGGRGSKGSNP